VDLIYYIRELTKIYVEDNADGSSSCDQKISYDTLIFEEDIDY
jgi:hypothetical protein